MSCRRRIHRQQAAFSLVEVMIVIVIIGLLAGAVTVNVRSYLIKAKQNVARQDIRVIGEAIDTWWGEHGTYPSNDQGLAVLTQAEGDSGEARLKGAAHGLRDPWGRPYVYNCPASRSNEPYEILCLGADGREGGSGADKDISSDDLGQE